MRTTRGLVAGLVLASALLTLDGAATAVAESNQDGTRRTSMAELQTLVDRNAKFARSFNQGDLPLLPRLSILVLTCLDARVDPAHFFGLELGDAVVMRNIGGRVTDEVIEQIAILRGLAVAGGGTGFELAIVHHTDCGASRFANPQARQKMGAIAGTGEAAIGRLAITDPRISVAEDLDRLRAAPTLQDKLVVAGYVYDVSDGHVREVVAPASLRKGDGS
jgi:carbonic anhydrase